MLASGTFVPSTNTDDWLGRGIYFFDSAPLRARTWARYRWQGGTDQPAVLRATIDLNGCIDMFDSMAFAAFRKKYSEFLAHEQSHGASYVQAGLLVADGLVFTTDSGETDPRKRPPIRNFRDRAFLDWFVGHMADGGVQVRSIRGVFLDGKALFPTSFLFDWAHVQIAVLDPAAISDMTLEFPRQPGTAAP
jgi:hypothetical protein